MAVLIEYRVKVPYSRKRIILKDIHALLLWLRGSGAERSRRGCGKALFCSSVNSATCTVVDGRGARVGLSLSLTWEEQGYTSANTQSQKRGDQNNGAYLALLSAVSDLNQ